MVSWRRIQYRFSQFFHVLFAKLQPVDTAYAIHHLPKPELQTLFNSMSRQERNHAIDVCRKMEAAGHDNEDLLVAALLHDVGKRKQKTTIFERVCVVLGEYAFPEATKRWSDTQYAKHILRRGFVVRQHHAQWGAEMAVQAGASARTVELIRRHHELAPDDTDIIALHEADDR